MPQKTITSYFNTRKRIAADDLNAKNKVIIVDQDNDHDLTAATTGTEHNLVGNHHHTDLNNAYAVVRSKPFAHFIESKDDKKNAFGNNEPPLTSSSTITTKGGKRKAQSQIMRIGAGIKKSIVDVPPDSKSIPSPRKPIANFILAGPLSPKVKRKCEGAALSIATVTPPANTTEIDTDKLSVTKSLVFDVKDETNNINRGMKTPTKEQQMAKLVTERLILERKNMSYTDIKNRVTRSKRLEELKESMERLRNMDKKRQVVISKNTERINALNATAAVASASTTTSLAVTKDTTVGLKKFDHIDLEILTSPQKGYNTPTKIISTSTSSSTATTTNDLMSPKKTTSRQLFSPVKVNIIDGSPTTVISPTKTILPAYQRYHSLAEKGHPTLQMPYKYRCLIDMFKCLDSVCCMYFNRHETITFKKLRPGVQRLLRKNFTENHLAQIMHIYPDAFKFHQKKMLNPGSHTKYDYYQLVIIPNIKKNSITTTTTTTGKCGPTSLLTSPSDKNMINVIKLGEEQIMNPQVMTERQQILFKILLELVKVEHDTFLKSLNPPMHIDKQKITRWHPEFNLDGCPDIPIGNLPKPPNIERFSSAKDVLSTAKNLFGCATPMEKALNLWESKKNEMNVGKNSQIYSNNTTSCTVTSTTSTNTTVITPPEIINDPVANALKGLPKALLEKIRAKQSAKALAAMTRRPSQDKEALNFGRLPELARHLRNIFVTECRGVLEFNFVVTKIENSYKIRLSREQICELIKLIGQEAPNKWLTVHTIRTVDYVKINKSQDINIVIGELEKKAKEKFI